MDLEGQVDECERKHGSQVKILHVFMDEQKSLSLLCLLQKAQYSFPLDFTVAHPTPL